ncbi:MAG: penicillin-binding protein activator, partial [Proteobacteria bacterium]|nr:penicillin-binding protein activator [Pseudomonadota bacterium]
QITRARGFSGVDGRFRLLPDGTSERGLAILEVQKFSARVIQPAPIAFGRAQF